MLDCAEVMSGVTDMSVFWLDRSGADYLWVMWRTNDRQIWKNRCVFRRLKPRLGHYTSP